MRPGEAGERVERVVEQLAVRVQQDRDVVARQLEPGVRGGPEARVVAPLEHVRAPAGAAGRGAVVAPRVDHHDLRPHGQARLDGAQQELDLGGRLVQHDDDRVGHGAGP